MYIQQCLARDRYAERLKRAHDERVANSLAELNRMQRRQDRAERELLDAWQRVDQLRSDLWSLG